VKALRGATWLALIQDDFRRGEELCEESLPLSRELGDKRGIAFALYHQAWIVEDIPTAEALINEAITIFSELDDKEGLTLSYVF